MIDSGTVKWFNDAKGIGFIISDIDGKQVFAEKWKVKTEPQTLFEFQKVKFNRVDGSLGLEAEDIEVTETQDLSFYDHEMISLKGERIHFSQYLGQVVLVVNTASKCGLTPQYESLEKLHQLYKDKGLAVIAFPTNNFAGQEPLANNEIESFCKVNYGVTFKVMEKINCVNKDSTQPGQQIEDTNNQVHSLYKLLAEKTGQTPQWNFHKYLINCVGSTVLSFDHVTNPLDLTVEIEKLLEDTL